MRCPNCDGSNSRVIDSRLTTAEDATRRRRECDDCEYRFTTYERIERRPVLIIKKTGGREVFDRDKMLGGMLKALHRRPVTAEQIEMFAARVEHELAESKQREVPSTVVGDHVMSFLRRVDKIAYVRYASVYREFEDISSLMREVESLFVDDLDGESQ